VATGAAVAANAKRRQRKRGSVQGPDDTGTGQIQTVLGPIPPAELGRTLMHEHVFLDYSLPLDQPALWRSVGLDYPDTPEKRVLWNAPYSAAIDSLLWVGWPQNRDSLRLDDYDAALWEMQQLREVGGAVTSTLPMNVIDEVEFSPALHPKVIQAAKEQHTGQGVKVYAKTAKPVGNVMMFGAVDGRRSAIVFDRKVLSRPLRTADTRLLEALTFYLADKMKVRGSDSDSELLPRLRHLIVISLGEGDIHIEDVARQLGMSRRTPQRRLSIDSSNRTVML